MRHILPLTLFFLLLSPHIVAQEQTIEKEPLIDSGQPVVIEEIDLQVKGLSSKAILRNRIRVAIGDKFANLSELRKVLELSFNELRSSGYFKRDVGVSYQITTLERTETPPLPETNTETSTETNTEISTTPNKTNGPLRLKIEAKFQDAWTIYPIAYPNYTSDSGFGLRGRLKWDNFLGTLADVTLRLNITDVRDGEYGLDYAGSLGLSTIKLTPYFGINASLSLTHDARVDGANWQSGFGIGGSFTIPWLQNSGIGMGYSISNSSSFTFAYTGVEYTRPYFSSSFSHSLSLGKVRYSDGGIFRDGYNLSLGNSFGFDSDSGSLTETRVFALEDIRLDFSVKLSRSYANIINFKGRVGLGKSFDFSNGKRNQDGYNFDAKSYNRGKRENLAEGDFIVYLNMDMMILVFRDELLGDVLLEPFFDMAWLNGPNGFQLEEIALGTGFDLIWAFHSLKFRFGYGIDLNNPEQFNITITTGFYF